MAIKRQIEWQKNLHGKCTPTVNRTLTDVYLICSKEAIEYIFSSASSILKTAFPPHTSTLLLNFPFSKKKQKNKKKQTTKQKNKKTKKTKKTKNKKNKTKKTKKTKQKNKKTQKTNKQKKTKKTKKQNKTKKAKKQNKKTIGADGRHEPKH